MLLYITEKTLEYLLDASGVQADNSLVKQSTDSLNTLYLLDDFSVYREPSKIPGVTCFSSFMLSDSSL